MTSDPISRSIDFVPTKQPYDPRNFLAGIEDTLNQTWKSGFFDRGSFTEALAGK